MTDTDKLKRVVSDILLSDTTPRELSDVISLGLSDLVGKLGTEKQDDEAFLNMSDLIATVMDLLEKNKNLSDEFKANVKKHLQVEIAFLDNILTDVISNANKIEDTINGENKMNENKTTIETVKEFVKENKVKTGFIAIAAVVTTIVGYQVYRHYNPKDILVNLSDALDTDAFDHIPPSTTVVLAEAAELGLETI